MKKYKQTRCARHTNGKHLLQTAGALLLALLLQGCTAGTNVETTHNSGTQAAAPLEEIAAQTSENATAGVYHDGIYSAVSSIKDERGGSAKVTITISDGKITAVDFLLYDKDGKLKDESYGQNSNAALYKKAQDSLAKAQEYAEQLIATQDLDQVDAVAGATMNYDLFKNVVQEALQMALQNPDDEAYYCDPDSPACDISLTEPQEADATQGVLAAETGSPLQGDKQQACTGCTPQSEAETCETCSNTIKSCPHCRNKAAGNGLSGLSGASRPNKNRIDCCKPVN